jgi:hypothetical protein
MTRYILAVMAVLGCLAVAPPHARAQTAAPAPVKIAVVDLDLVGDKFERKIVEENKLREWGQQQQAMIDQLSALPFLSTDEWQEAVAIYQTPKASWT